MGVVAHGHVTMPSKSRVPELVLFHSLLPIKHPLTEAWSTALGAKEVPQQPHTLPFPLHI